MMAFPDKAIRIARLVCNAGRHKDALVACMPNHDGFYEVHVIEVGVGRSRALSLSLSSRQELFLKGVKLDDHFSGLISLIETYGYDCIEDNACNAEPLLALLESMPGVECQTAEVFYNARTYDEYSLLPILCGIRVLIVIDEGVGLFDARSCKPLSDQLSQDTIDALSNAFKNPVSSRTVVEAFYVHGDIKVTDAYRVLGNDVTKVSYAERMRKLETHLKGTQSIPKLSIVKPVISNEHALRILCATQSLLKPSLLAKRGIQTLLVDKYRSQEVEVSQVKKGESKLSCFDGGPLNGRFISMPVTQMPSYANTYTLSGIRLGSQRLPILV